MVQSLNKKVDLTINATSYLGMANYGKVLVGDEAFEYYNDKNVNDYIQIPWSEVTEIMASVMFNPNNMVRSLSFFQVISRGLKSLFKRK